MKKEKMKNEKPLRIAVIGAGSWGTALALLLASNGHRVALWGHNKAHLRSMSVERENSRYLPGFTLGAGIEPESDLSRAADGAALVCMVVPSHAFRDVYRELAPRLDPGCTVVSAVKGIENDTLMTMTQVVADVHRELGLAQGPEVAVLSGPSFAKEVAEGLPTAITIGSADLQSARRLQRIFGSESFRVYASSDVIGLEISAALKNVVAVAAGICDGLGYGLNTRAALITRGLAEITRLGVAMGADPVTFSGLSGLGDLVLTCTGDLSRNRSVGIELGQGRRLEDIVRDMKMVAEGVKTTKSGYELARREGIEMPILEQVHAILYQGKDCGAAVRDLLSREFKEE